MLGLKVEILVHRVPLESYVKTSFGEMKDRPSVLIRIEDNRGFFGWGEVWCNFPFGGAEHRARILKSTILPMVSKLKNIDDPESVWFSLAKNLHILAIQTGEYGSIAQCLAGLECSLQDLCARRSGKPLFGFLSRESDPEVAVYASGINPIKVGETVTDAVKAGYMACKIKIGFDDESDRENLIQAKAILGERKLIADVNQAWTLERALKFREVISEVQLEWLEEPFPHDLPDMQWRQLAQQLDTRIAAGENFLSFNEFDQLPRQRSIRVLQPDLGKWGGVSQCLKIGNSLITEGMQFSPHWLGSGIGLLTSLHMKAAVGSKLGLVEVDFNTNPMRQHLTNAIFETLNQGKVRLPNHPGIGRIDPLISELKDYLVGREELKL